ncbi:MAG: Gfo/Idh/MocA family oxidoreductase [Bacteroidetes bacterium]|nr:Gfo/Idh/MocA family oxidoreductase [Bacteroidota bacterium]
MNDHDITRRNFVKLTSAGTIGLMTSGNFAYAGSSDVLRVGVIGCGGRGTGAARDAVISSEGIEITAMGDLFQDRLDASKVALKQEIGDAYKVNESHAFVGFDAYQHVLDCDIDLVILASPPGFRPKHFTAAVNAGKHIFMEKPVSVDVIGAMEIMSAGEIATNKGLSVVAGTLYRRQPSFVEGIKRIHDGMIGQIIGAQEYYLTGPIWLRERKAGMSDMEWQCRNWYYFTWLSGDHIVEQFVHNIDVINWVFQSHPDHAIAMGGRIARTSPEYGHIYDHFSVEYTYPGDVVVEAKCRQFSGSTNRVANRIVGTKGIAHLNPQNSVIYDHSGSVLYEMPEPGANGYVQEHADLIASVREGVPINETNQIAASTLTAVLGRESAYTGQQLSWDELMASNLDLQPSAHEFGPISTPPVSVPGITKLSRTTPMSVQKI